MKFRGVGNELITGWLQFKSSGQVRLLKRMTLGQNLEAVKRAIEVYGETDSRQRPSCAKTLTQACWFSVFKKLKVGQLAGAEEKTKGSNWR